MASTEIVGVLAIARAMGIPRYRARQLLEAGALRREWHADGVFVANEDDIRIWIESDQGKAERAIAKGSLLI